MLGCSRYFSEFKFWRFHLLSTIDLNERSATCDSLDHVCQSPGKRAKLAQCWFLRIRLQRTFKTLIQIKDFFDHYEFDSKPASLQKCAEEPALTLLVPKVFIPQSECSIVQVGNRSDPKATMNVIQSQSINLHLNHDRCKTTRLQVFILPPFPLQEPPTVPANIPSLASKSILAASWQ